MSYILVLDNGSRHEVTNVQLSYEIGTPANMKIKRGTIDGEPEALLSACTDVNVFLEAPNGTKHPVHVELVAGECRISQR